MSPRATSGKVLLSRALGTDLHLDLRRGDGSGIRARLMEVLREAVRSGRLPPGMQLPSSRSLAADLGLARNTVVDAYAGLIAEGWLTARRGSGTQVARRSQLRPPTRRRSPRPQAARPLFDLRPGRPDVSAFPRAEWMRAARRAMAGAPDEVFGYGDPQGRIELRTALAGYLARARGVQVNPEVVVICSGAVHGLMLLGSVLAARGIRSVGVETYGLGVHRNLLAQAGLKTPAVEVDDRGARADTLGEDPEMRAVLLTPAHQFPTGVVLHPDRRTAAIDWARSCGGLIIEDDYDGEFRHDRQPVGALQGLDPEHVAYLGTSSKALAPGLRLGWLVLPEHLVYDVGQAKGHTDYMCSATDQLTLAEFLTDGAYDRHVRAMRLSYRGRRDQLIDALASRAPHVRVSGIAAGLHAVIELPPDTERSTLRAAACHRIALDGLAGFCHPAIPVDRDALVIGYATPSNSGWAGALDALVGILP